jgi:hypothetical protein
VLCNAGLLIGVSILFPNTFNFKRITNAGEMVAFGMLLACIYLVHETQAIVERSKKKRSSSLTLTLSAIFLVAFFICAYLLGPLVYLWDISGAQARWRVREASDEVLLHSQIAYFTEWSIGVVQPFVFSAMLTWMTFRMIHWLLDMARSLLMEIHRDRDRSPSANELNTLPFWSIQNMFYLTAYAAILIVLVRALPNFESRWMIQEQSAFWLFGLSGLVIISLLSMFRLPLIWAMMLEFALLLSLARGAVWLASVSPALGPLTISDGLIPWSHSLGWSIALTGTLAWNRALIKWIFARKAGSNQEARPAVAVGESSQ